MGAELAAGPPQPARSMPDTRMLQARSSAATEPLYTPPPEDATVPSRDMGVTCSPGGGGFGGVARQRRHAKGRANGGGGGAVVLPSWSARCGGESRWVGRGQNAEGEAPPPSCFIPVDLRA